MKIVSSEEMREAEKYTIDEILPSIVLMENAAEKVVQIMKSEYSDLAEKNIVVVCGRGNNGGDGFAVARKVLPFAKSVKLIFCGDVTKLSKDAELNYKAAKKFEIEFIEKSEFEKYDIIVDAIFGTGLSREITGNLKEIIEKINSSKKTVVAVDIPSGVSADIGKTMGCSVKADITVTFQYAKYGHFLYPGREFCGKLFVEDISVLEILNEKFKREAVMKSDISLKRRENSINKTTAGKVMVIAGKRGFSGAAYMCSESCLREGAGLVWIAVPQSINDILENKTTEVITLPFEDGEEGNLTENCFENIEKFIKLNSIKTVLIGPGLGREEETLKLVRRVIENIDAKFIVDADGLYAIKECMEILNKKEVIITPHEGEFERITGKKIVNRVEEAESLADKYGITVVLKGADTIITNGKKSFINTSGNAGLAKGGSGDVLAGMISAFVSRGYSLEEAAKYGVYIHGYTADIIAENKSMESITATDLIENLGRVMKEFEK